MAFQMPDYSVLSGAQMDSFGGNIPLGSFASDGMALGQEYSLRHSIPMDGGAYGVAALTFDNVEELLWSGNQGGHLTSYFSSELQKYTSFDVCLNFDIREIVTFDAGVLSLTSSTLRLSNRRGLTIFNHCSEHLQAMQCMALTPKGTLLLGGHHSNLIELDLETCDEIRLIRIDESNCAILRKHPRFICCGDVNGKVSLHDLNTLRAEHVIECHSSMLSDFDVHGNHLITCGFSTGIHGEIAPDAFLMVYDIRMMRSVTPIQMMFPPFLLRFITKYTSRLCVVSQTGQFQIFDTGNSDQYGPFIHQVETTANVSSFATSSSSQALAFGDSSGYIHLYAASDQAQFNAFSRPTDFADSVEPLHSIDINDELTPLSSIPLPSCHNKYLSDWPSEFLQKAYRPTPPIDPQILSSMKMVGSIGYAPNPGNRLRNQVPYQLNKNSTQSSPILKDDGPETVPQRYLKMGIKYTRAGLDDIDFNKYNLTSFSGLEASLPNSYCNNMLQVLYFIEPLRCALLSHLCQKEFCLSCELGFLFHMLDTAQGIPCQANNFLRAFRTIPEASALSLIITDLSEAKKRGNITTLVQRWTRFMLQQIHTETLGTGDSGIREDSERPSDSSESIMNKLFGAKQFSCNRCRCNSETCQEKTTLLSSIVYPKNHHLDIPPVRYSFAEILKKSLAVEQNITAWCEKCNKFQNMVQTRVLKSLPDILVLSCGLENEQDTNFWKTQLELLGESKEQSVMKVLPDVPVMRKKACRYGNLCKRKDCMFYHEHKDSLTSRDISDGTVSWIPLGFHIKLSGGKITVEDGTSKIDNEYKAFQTDTVEPVEENVVSAEYELTAIVSVIVDGQDSGCDNIISCIKVGPQAHVRHKGSPASQWYLFNDFSIVPITSEEAVYLNFDWKLPSVLYFKRIDLNARYDLSVFNPVEEQVFRDDVSLARSGQSHITFTPLTADDPPKSGQLVAIDAEFVTLNQEEAEIRSDGTRSTIRPSQFSVARISCVRGEGPLEGVPFIDDYISTQEQLGYHCGYPTPEINQQAEGDFQSRKLSSDSFLYRCNNIRS